MLDFPEKLLRFQMKGISKDDWRTCAMLLKFALALSNTSRVNTFSVLRESESASARVCVCVFVYTKCSCACPVQGALDRWAILQYIRLFNYCAIPDRAFKREQQMALQTAQGALQILQFIYLLKRVLFILNSQQNFDSWVMKFMLTNSVNACSLQQHIS